MSVNCDTLLVSADSHSDLSSTALNNEKEMSFSEGSAFCPAYKPVF